MTVYGRSEELVSRCVECNLAEPESLASLGGSAPGLVDGILSPMESVYSGVVSLRGLRLVMFLAELNTLLLWGGDVSNAYLEAHTREKLCIIARPEFGELQDHIFSIYKALYGTRTGGACWHDKLFGTLQHMGFQPSKAGPDIWIRPLDDRQAFEYIAVYVYDLCVASKDPAKIFQTLKIKYKIKPKGDGPLDYHLG